MPLGASSAPTFLASPMQLFPVSLLDQEPLLPIIEASDDFDGDFDFDLDLDDDDDDEEDEDDDEDEDEDDDDGGKNAVSSGLDATSDL